MDERTEIRPGDAGDARITEMLREIYAPPAEGAYWDALGIRIMAHVATNRDTESLIPFVSAIVPTVDVAGGFLVVDPPEGLLDL